MSPDPNWISKKALLLLHEESLAAFGGARGMRDKGLLDSALARPHNTLAYNSDSSIADLAASYAYGLARNHPFVDGNKRMAFLSIGLFLALNGHQLLADPVDAISHIQNLAGGELPERELADWINAHMQKI